MIKFILGLFLLVIVSFVFMYVKPVSMNSQEQEKQNNSNATLSSSLPWPLERASERGKLLTFGMFVSPDPEQNPITPPERFTGFHSGLDIEILPEEKDASVLVKAICDGKIIYTGSVEGYGGVIIQQCNINNQPTSVLYGHLRLSSFRVSAGETPITQSTELAELGTAYSNETGGTRKHLHLGMHKGNHIEFLGYVNIQEELAEFIDPFPLLEKF
jgi:hypothetical protein